MEVRTLILSPLRMTGSAHFKLIPIPSLTKMKLRKAQKTDLKKIIILHKKAAETIDGIARTPEEINENYVSDFLDNALKKGLIFVIENPNNSQELIAEIHCYKYDPKCFQHTLGNLKIVVHPNFQNQGLGRIIFAHLLKEIETNHQDIVRVELMVRQSNEKAIKLYQNLGFEIEGICKNRISNSEGKLESDMTMAWLNSNFINQK